MVDSFGGAYAPNTEYLEYYVKKPDHIVVFKSNYGTYHGDANQDGTLEKELLPAVVSTLKYTQQ